MRTLCEARGITIAREKPLHSLFGEYVKRLREDGQLESEMTARIPGSAISVLEAFNGVRNNRSLAHDNPILNYDESLLTMPGRRPSSRIPRERVSRCRGLTPPDS